MQAKQILTPVWRENIESYNINNENTPRFL